MKKGKYIDIYVIMACMSRRKQKSNLQQVDELLEKACEDCEETSNEETGNEPQLVDEELIAG